MIRVTDVESQDGHGIWLRYSDGATGSRAAMSASGGRSARIRCPNKAPAVRFGEIR